MGAPAPETDFARLLGTARDGGTAAFEAIYRKFGLQLLRYLRAKEPGDAEDLASDVWVAVARQLRTFQGDEDGFRAWLFTIANRRVIDLRRRRGRRRTDPVAPDQMAERASTQHTDVVVIDQLAGQAVVDRLVAPLGPAQAEVVLLRIVGGLSVEHVARIMRRSPGAVRVLQHRALKRLARDAAARTVTG